MADYFPTDVSVRLGGDRQAAQAQLGAARKMLFKALLMNQASGGMPVHLSERLSDNDFATVSIVGDQKIVNIYSIIGPTTTTETVETFVPKTSDGAGQGYLYMLSGIARVPTSFTDGDGNVLLRDFRPTPTTATAYEVPNAYADNLKLGGGVSQILTTKASQFSGSIKRVVQAVFGLGKIKDDSGYYLTPPSATTRTVPMLYGWNYQQTHGVYKAGPKNWWLIEISASRGVLAMPLPLIPSTRRAAYKTHLTNKNDVGGLAVVNEFGGLPSGETFPTGTDLTDAITDGKVLRLLQASDLTPYYQQATRSDSWAFSESGAAADNTKFVWGVRPGETIPSVSGEHWRINLDLSTYNLNPGVGNPVGTGTATLTRLHSGKISKAGMRSYWIGGPEILGATLYSYAALPNMQDVPHASSSSTYFGAPTVDRGFGTSFTPVKEEYRDWGCIVRVFYVGDRCERVKWVPHYVWENWTEAEQVPAASPGGDPNMGPWWKIRSSWGIKYSPQGFVSDSIDLRKISILQSDTPPIGLYNTYDRHRYYQAGRYRYPGADDPSWHYFVYDWSSEVRDPIEFVVDYGPDSYTTSDGSAPIEYEIFTNQSAYTFSGYEASWRSGGHSLGSGSYDGRPNATCALWAMAPGACREGIVICRVYRYTESAASEVKGMALFPQTGVFQVAVDAKFGTNFSVPDYRFPMYFGAVMNAGPSLAYTMTNKVQYQPEHEALTSESPGWNHYNLLPDTGNLSVRHTNFIGSY